MDEYVFCTDEYRELTINAVHLIKVAGNLGLNLKSGSA